VVIRANAVGIGLLLGQSQKYSAAAPAPTAAPTALPQPQSNEVYIEPNSGGSPEAIYQPAVRTIHVGETVTWINLDSIDHTATADDGSFDTSVLATGRQKTWTAKKPGHYPYGDFLHPDVRGTIVVLP
jgi:plastocyanin